MDFVRKIAGYWKNLPDKTTPLMAADLERYEAGIVEGVTKAEAAGTAAGTAQTTATAAGTAASTAQAAATTAGTIAGTTGLQSALDVKASFVLVTTGTEARPAGAFCIWSGGTVQPTNMGANDLWWASAPPPDTTPPSVPTGLNAGTPAATAFTLSWTASTGTPTLYEVFTNGVSAGTTAGTSMGISGKVANTDYSMTVRARDAAGNWSAQSAALVVHTAVGGGPVTHTVFGNTAPMADTLYTDGGPSLATGNHFYAGVGTDAWRIKGARFYVPAPATALVGKNLAVRCMTPQDDGTLKPIPATGALWDDGVANQVLMTNLQIGWNEVNFATPIDFNPIAANAMSSHIYIAGMIYDSNPSTGNGMYLHSGVMSLSSTQAVDGSNLWMAASGESLGWNTAIGYVTGVYYGFDVIMQES